MSRRSGNRVGARSYPAERTANVPSENVAPLLIRPCQGIEETVGGPFRAPAGRFRVENVLNAKPRSSHHCVFWICEIQFHGSSEFRFSGILHARDLAEKVAGVL